MRMLYRALKHRVQILKLELIFPFFYSPCLVLFFGVLTPLVSVGTITSSIRRAHRHRQQVNDPLFMLLTELPQRLHQIVNLAYRRG